jgi:hypothetical protein
MWGCGRPIRPSNWHLGVAANEANLTAVVSSAVACERLAEAVVAFRESDHVADVLMAAELDGPRAVCRLETGFCFARFTGQDDGGRPLPSPASSAKPPGVPTSLGSQPRSVAQSINLLGPLGRPGWVTPGRADSLCLTCACGGDGVLRGRAFPRNHARRGSSRRGWGTPGSRVHAQSR